MQIYAFIFIQQNFLKQLNAFSNFVVTIKKAPGQTNSYDKGKQHKEKQIQKTAQIYNNKHIYRNYADNGMHRSFLQHETF